MCTSIFRGELSHFLQVKRFVRLVPNLTGAFPLEDCRVGRWVCCVYYSYYRPGMPSLEDIADMNLYLGILMR